MRIVKKDKIFFKEERDPFNPQNVLCGFIHKADISKMYITEVNGEYTNQTIHCTPKLQYPFDRDGNFHFPKCAISAESYEKLDGVNVLQYLYKDENFKSFTSYKTRKTMFPAEEFELLIKKCLKRNPVIHRQARNIGMNISWELCGYLYPITILYDWDIKMFLLFGINQGRVLTPENLYSSSVECANLCKTMKTISKKNYNEERELLEKKLKKQDEYYKGSEGSVWYVYTESFTKMYKLKPPTIEKLHWGSASAGKHNIINTLKNAMEDYFPLTYDIAEEYLLEEFTQKEVDSYKVFIEQKIEKLNRKKRIEIDAIKFYKENDLDFNDKDETMRLFAKKFGRHSTTEIYNILKKYFKK